jgi:hypothetical protein
MSTVTTLKYRRYRWLPWRCRRYADGLQAIGVAMALHGEGFMVRLVLRERSDAHDS